MNFYLHFRKKNMIQSDVPERPRQPMPPPRTPRFKSPKSSNDFHALALEHAAAYFKKPWDQFLKEAKTANECKMCHPESRSVTGCSDADVVYTEKQGQERFAQNSLDLWRNICRRVPRYEYTALADDSIIHDRLEMDRKLQRDTDRNMSTIRCQYYLRSSNRYVFLRHLPDMGSRLDKNWFLVRDGTTKTERLLTMTPMAEYCPMKYNTETRQILLDLFLALQHPYIYPVLDIDRKIVMEQEYVIAVLPFNYEGTLKDFIYKSQCQEDWKEKYHFQGDGLSSSQIQRFGCQILEALLFLKDQRFPPNLHLHSGNIIIQNGAARISGLENTLFGYSSRSHLFIPRRLHENKEAVEIMCFGHLLFEMATGYELTSHHPSEKNYLDLDNKPLVVDVIKFIFEQGRYRYPSLQQVISLDFFRHIDLRELRSVMPMPSIKAKLSPAALSLLKEVKRHQRSKRQSKRSQSLHAVETGSADGRDSRSSGNSNRSSRKKKKRSVASADTTPEGNEAAQLRSMPLTSIEGSLRVTTSTSGSLDYYTPPSTPQICPRPTPESSGTRALFLQEIQGGFKLKKSPRSRNIDV